MEKRAPHDKPREPRDNREDRSREYDRTREYEKESHREHDRTPEKKIRPSPKRGRDVREKKRSESRGRSRDRESKREKREERVREKSSVDRIREHKEKEKKLKERKKKRKEKESEKKRKREKKEKKDKDTIKKEDGDNNEVKTNLSADVKEGVETDKQEECAVAVQNNQVDETEHVKIEPKKESQNDLYGDDAEAVDKEIIQNYVKAEDVNTVKEDIAVKEEPFDGIELQANADELDLKIENESSNTQNKNEVLAPLPR
ncbi:hypothetical protein ACJJTC_004074 [Scirpophaga incertulas]